MIPIKFSSGLDSNFYHSNNHTNIYPTEPQTLAFNQNIHISKPSHTTIPTTTTQTIYVQKHLTHMGDYEIVRRIRYAPVERYERSPSPRRYETPVRYVYREPSPRRSNEGERTVIRYVTRDVTRRYYYDTDYCCDSYCQYYCCC